MATEENVYLDNEEIKEVLWESGFDMAYNIADEDKGKHLGEIELLLEITEIKFNILYLKSLLNNYIESVESLNLTHKTSINEIWELETRIKDLEAKLEEYTKLNYTLC